MSRTGSDRTPVSRRNRIALRSQASSQARQVTPFTERQESAIAARHGQRACPAECACAARDVDGRTLGTARHYPFGTSLGAVSAAITELRENGDRAWRTHHGDIRFAEPSPEKISSALSGRHEAAWLWVSGFRRVSQERCKRSQHGPPTGSELKLTQCPHAALDFYQAQDS